MSILEVDKALIVEVLNKTERFHSDDLKVLPITLENLNDASWFNDADTLESFRQFLKKGHLGYYCYKDGVCIFRTWIFTNSENTFVGRNFVYQLAPNEVFSGWSETAPDYRGLGAFPFTLNHIIHENPKFHISAYIAQDNIGSIKGTLKTGFVTTRKFTLIRFWRIRIQMENFRLNKNFFCAIRLGTTIQSLLGR